MRLVGDVDMSADGADLRRRDPQPLQGMAPLVSRGPHQFFWKRGGKETISSETLSTGVLVNSAPAAAFAGAFLGCLATLHLSAYGFVPAIASALATVLLCGPLLVTRTTGLFPGEFFAPIYGGTFAGMTPVLDLRDNAPGASLMPASALFVLLSIVSGIAFCVVAEIDARSGRRLAGGYGGRSGAIATVASFLFVEAALLLGADDRLFRAAHAEMLDAGLRSLALTCAAGMIGMCATLLVLRRRSVASAEPAERIFIAAAVALIGMMVLYLNDANDAHTLDAFYAGCFLGMSTPERLKGWIQPVLGVILLTAILVVDKTLLPDIGGGLGFAAFVAVVVLQAPSRLTTWTSRLPTWTKTWLTTSNRTRGKPLQTAALASASVSPIPEMPIRGAAIAASLASLLVMGWFAMPHQVASGEPGLNMVSAPVVVPAAQILEQVALVQGKPNSVDEATPIGLPPGTASSDAVNPDPALSLELNVRDILAAHGVSADTRAEAGRADLIAGAATQTTEAVQSETRIDAATQSNDEIFREFVQWRAARAGAVAQVRPQPVKRSRNPAFQVVRLTPPASIRTSPRAPTRTPAIRPAPVQPRP